MSRFLGNHVRLRRLYALARPRRPGQPLLLSVQTKPPTGGVCRELRLSEPTIGYRVWLVKGVQFIFDVLPFYSVPLVLPYISLNCHSRIKLDCHVMDISIEFSHIFCSDFLQIFPLLLRFFHRSPIF